MSSVSWGPGALSSCLQGTPFANATRCVLWTAHLPPLPVLGSLVLAPTLDWESRGLVVTGSLGVP